MPVLGNRDREFQMFQAASTSSFYKPPVCQPRSGMTYTLESPGHISPSNQQEYLQQHVCYLSLAVIAEECQNLCGAALPHPQ